MVGTMANGADRRKEVRGHAMKGRQYEAKFKALEDPTIVAYARLQNLP
jgi:hypothetical protein